MFKIWWTKIKYWVIGVVVTIAFIYGVQSERNRNKLKEYEETINAYKKAKRIEDEVEAYNVSDLDNELSKWMRDSK